MFRKKIVRVALATLSLSLVAAVGFHPSGTAHHDAGVRWSLVKSQNAQ